MTNDNVIALDGQYIDLRNPSHFGAALRAVNAALVADGAHVISEDDPCNLVAAVVEMALFRWVAGQTDDLDREVVANHVKHYDL